jgi:hypothetical protein
MGEFPNNQTITSFEDLLNEFCWSYEFPSYKFIKDEKGNFYLNKLYIAPDHMSYKTTYWNLAPGVFKHVERFYEFLLSTRE